MRYNKLSLNLFHEKLSDNKISIYIFFFLVNLLLNWIWGSLVLTCEVTYFKYCHVYENIGISTFLCVSVD